MVLYTLTFRFSFFSLHKTWSSQLKISSVNENKSAGNCGFGHIYWRNPQLKTFCAVFSDQIKQLNRLEVPPGVLHNGNLIFPLFDVYLDVKTSNDPSINLGDVTSQRI